MPRLTHEREQIIREQLAAYKHWHTTRSCNDYSDTHGPTMEELLSEIDALRAELLVKSQIDGNTVIALKERDQLKIENVLLKADKAAEIISNTKSVYRGSYLVQENEKLLERVAKLREAWIILSQYLTDETIVSGKVPTVFKAIREFEVSINE